MSTQTILKILLTAAIAGLIALAGIVFQLSVTILDVKQDLAELDRQRAQLERDNQQRAAELAPELKRLEKQLAMQAEEFENKRISLSARLTREVDHLSELSRKLQIDLYDAQRKLDQLPGRLVITPEEKMKLSKKIRSSFRAPNTSLATGDMAPDNNSSGATLAAIFF